MLRLELGSMMLAWLVQALHEVAVGAAVEEGIALIRQRMEEAGLAPPPGAVLNVAVVFG